VPEKLTAEQEKHVRAKVETFLPDFLAHIDKPHKHYALSYAIELLAQELTKDAEADQEVRDSFQALSDYVAYINKPEMPKGERQQLQEQLMNAHKRRGSF
jgi:hypothetical protein